MKDDPPNKIDEMSRAIGDLEATVTYLGDQIHQLRKEIKGRMLSRGFVTILGVVIAGVFSWLAVLTYIIAGG